jgi:hypothetical protein
MERADTQKKDAKNNKTPSQTAKTIAPQSANYPLEQIKLLHQTAGNQAVQRLYKAGKLQAALKISRPDDIYEREADRVADAVMRMPENTAGSRQSAVSDAHGVIQTKPG